MSDTQYKMIGIFSIVLSIFFLLGGLYLSADVVPVLASRLCLIGGLVLLIFGVVFYKVMKN